MQQSAVLIKKVEHNTHDRTRPRTSIPTPRRPRIIFRSRHQFQLSTFFDLSNAPKHTRVLAWFDVIYVCLAFDLLSDYNDNDNNDNDRESIPLAMVVSTPWPLSMDINTKAISEPQRNNEPITI